MPAEERPDRPDDEPSPVRLMNTLRASRGTVHDDLGSAADAARWLRDAGFPVGEPAPEDVAALVSLRDALRVVAARVTGDDRDPLPAPGVAVPTEAPRGGGPADVEAALGLLDRCASRAPAGALRLDGGRVRRTAPPRGRGVAEAVAVLAGEAVALLTGADAGRLRACHGPRCVLFFVQDHPRRQWCTAACGTRARAVRHYRRRQAGGVGGAPSAD